MNQFPPVSGLEIVVNLIQGRGLVAKDRNLITRKKTTSDPFVKIFLGGTLYGKSKTVKKNLSPVWNESFTIKLGANDANRVIKSTMKGDISPWTMVEFRIFDEDKVTEHDPMGLVFVSLQSIMVEEPTASWYPVEKGKQGKDKKGQPNHYCKNATGDLEIKVSISGHKMPRLERGNNYQLDTTSRTAPVPTPPRTRSVDVPAVVPESAGPPPTPTTTGTAVTNGIIRVGLGWEMEHGKPIDLDSSCIAVDYMGNILMGETVYYGNLVNSNGSIRHSGDEKEGSTNIEGTTDKEVIVCDLNHVPGNILALYFLLTAVTPNYSFQMVETASVTVVNEVDGMGLCNFTPAFEGSNTAMFLFRLSRDKENGGWMMSIIQGTNATARDFGTLVPEIKGYSRDLIPNIVIDPKERVAVMRKGGTIRIQDYSRSASSKVPDRLTFGLAWDVTDGVNIDLDASVICLDRNLQCLDIVFFKQLRSRDGAIVHGGDEREGDEIGDDEKIFLTLNMVHPEVQYIGVVINSYSGQELDDVASASCHLFDTNQGYDLAKYTLTNAKELDGFTALVMGCLYRGGGGGGVVHPGYSKDGGGPPPMMGGSTDWFFRVISEPAMGRVAHELVDELQAFLRANPPQPPAIVPEPDIIVETMPPAKPVEEEEISVEPIVPVYDQAAGNVVAAPALGRI